MKIQNQIKVLFSALVYILAWGAIVYYLDFFTGFYVPKTIDQGIEWPLGYAMIWDLILLLGIGVLFETARKRAFLDSLPEGLERSIRVLIYVGGLVLLIALWRPINETLFDFRDHGLATLFTGSYYWGWWMCLTATFLLDHWSRFGLRQSLNLLDGKNYYRATAFKTPLLYLLVRHPVYLGIIIFHFSTPYLSLGRLLLAVGITFFLIRQSELDEVDLLNRFGDRYRTYQQKVPKVFPWQKAHQQSYGINSSLFSSIDDPHKG
ncbi:MAG: isoprenylcysteine carboxylmethyltransferase family protein [Bacteroidia bacterium]